MPELLLDVTHVWVLPDYHLALEFENGERRLFDMRPYLNRPPFYRLQHAEYFALARVEYGTVVWPGQLDIAPETLYDGSVAYT